MTRSLVVFLVVILGADMAIARANAFRTTPQEDESAQPASDDESGQEAETFAGLEYRLIGPYAGGRVSRVCGVPGDPLTYYAATAAGGVWKTVQGGTEWKPVFDDQPISSIGSIVVAPSDPNVVWVGSGEANIRGNTAEGNGIYLSTDAGESWTHVWKAEGQIGSLAVHPKRPEVLYAAVLGSPFGPTQERGIYRTRDSGQTWERILFVDENVGASDICLDPSNPRILFAGLWEARRTPWNLTSGGEKGGLFVSRDGGDSWKALKGQGGLPQGVWGRIGVRVSPSNSKRVYALLEAEQGGLYRSDDGGESWTLVQDSRGLTQRAWYYMTLTIDPSDKNTVWFPQVPMLKSEDGGESIRSVKGGGWDYHDVWIAPDDSRRLIVASDAGVSLSRDGGKTWMRPPLPISQFYHISLDTNEPYRVLGSVQDYGTVSGPSHSLHSGGILASDWRGVGGGEAGHVVADPDDPSIVWAGEYLGIITRWDGRLNHASVVSVYPYDGSGHSAQDLRFRFQWTAPILISPHDSETVYHASNVLFRTRDAGQTWTPISPDLSYDDPSKQEWSGGPITGDNTGVEFYGTIFALAESSHQKGEIWAGTDDGRLHLTQNGGVSWVEITPSDLPKWTTIRCIELSEHTSGVGYVVADAHRLDDETPYLWTTDDHGQSWRSLSASLDPEVYLHVIREDSQEPSLLFLGTERGVQVSRDAGQTFESLKLNMPTVAVVDMQVSENDLVVATLGRSAWILDDLTPVRQWSRALAEKTFHLFEPLTTLAWRIGEAPDGSSEGAGANPPSGVSLTYYLKEALEDPFVIRIKDGEGRVLRELRSEARESYLDPKHPDAEPDLEMTPDLSADQGFNRVSWDLTEEPPSFVKGALLDWGHPGSGPRVLPGTYLVEMTIGDETQAYGCTLEPDPRVKISREDREIQRDFARRVLSLFNEMAEEIRQIRLWSERLESWRARWVEKDAWKDLAVRAATIVEELEEIERRLHNPEAEVAYDILGGRHGGAMLYSQAQWLLMISRDHLGPPTQGMLESYEAYREELAAYQQSLRQLKEGPIQELEGLCRERKVPYIISD